MNLKLKLTAAACAVLCSAGAFAAATPITCTTASVTTLADLVNKCAPEVTFYLGGASAQQGALNTVLAAGGGIFDTTKIRGKITLTGSKTVGYIGVGDSTDTTGYAGKRVLVIYNQTNGSAAGVLQLLTGKGTGAGEETTLVTATAKNLLKAIAGSCTVATEVAAGVLGNAVCPATSVAPFKSAWGADAQKSMHMALSDVRPNELSPNILVGGKVTKALTGWNATKFPAERLLMQGFGVIVNPALYTALITKEIAAGRLAASCATSETVGGATDVITAACQPNLSRADYASIITGKISTATALLGTTDTKVLNLARRVESSGTQATSNIFFAGQANYNAKTSATTAANFDGFAPLVGLTSGFGAIAATAPLVVTEGSGTGDVITAVSGNTTDYALGVVSLENTYSMTKSASLLKGALFVKLDGISPNFDSSGALDAMHRVGLQAGYPYAFEAYAVKPTGLAGAYNGIYTKIVGHLKDTTRQALLPGQAYIGTGTAFDTPYTHNGNNYLPLSK